jgi:3-(3-hydroxy-phenyl)propionate hydroxylase
VSIDHHFGFGWRLIIDPLLRVPELIDGIDVIPIGGHGFTETETVVADWMRAYECRAVLLRPDHYVYGAAKTANTLRRLLVHWRKSHRDQ